MIPTIDFTVDDLFKVPYLETFFNGVEPEQSSDLLLMNKFFPKKFVDESDIVTLHGMGYTGRTPAVSKSAEVPVLTLPPYYVKDYQFGYWGEGAKLDKETLQRAEAAKNPVFATQGLIDRYLSGMAYRNNKVFEWTSAQTLWAGAYTIAANGVNYTYSDGIPAHYRLDMTDGGFAATYWTPAAIWSTIATSKPLNDILQMIRYAGTLGLSCEEIIMSPSVATLIETSADVIGWLKANPQSAREEITAEYAIQVIAKLKALTVTVDPRTHTERAIVMADASASATVIQVDDIANFATNDWVVVKQGISQARRKVSGTSTDGYKKYVTLTVTPGFALTAGKAVIDIGVPYCPANKVAFRTTKQGCAGWMILPDNIRAEDPMEAKIHIWSKFVNKEPNYWREIGNYFKGGVINRERGNYLIIQVQA